MPKDVFCKIIEKELPADFLIETDKLVVFKDIKPKAPVHYLVVPKKHIETINEIGEEDKILLGDMVMLAKDSAKKLGIEDGYKLIFNVGSGGGQEVPHIHLHILGGWK